MTSKSAQVQMTRRLPGDEGPWVFIAIDTFLFGAFFTSFVYDRLKDVELFNRSQEALSTAIGVVNTLILLASSWFVVLAVHAAKKNMGTTVRNCLMLALLCGVSFAVSKYFEYTAKFDVGLNLLTNNFYTYYFSLTGIHLAHVIIGMVVLGLLARAASGGVNNGRYLRFLESGASYWHMVDLIWIMLFTLLYLLR